MNVLTGATVSLGLRPLPKIEKCLSVLLISVKSTNSCKKAICRFEKAEHQEYISTDFS